MMVDFVSDVGCETLELVTEIMLFILVVVLRLEVGLVLSENIDAQNDGCRHLCPLKKMANEEFIKLFPRENGAKKAHYYKFPNCYELLTSTSKCNFDNAKSLRDVQTKGKNKASKSSYSSSSGDSSCRESQFRGENESEALNQRPDEGYRPIGAKTAKRKYKVDAMVDAKVNAALEIHERRH